jgi:hypothetical protein
MQYLFAATSFPPPHDFAANDFAKKVESHTLKSIKN